MVLAGMSLCLKGIRDSIHAYEQGVMPSGGTVFTSKGIEYGIDVPFKRKTYRNIY